ncbi:MFS transporter [Teredinibacter turnerae]|uniref:MFS transporter n=1 Tax=Teredinibacter turnerae TaxID=2426 RepID=UPI0004777479|nr:MFS transporter [Teredinibacter turnerae]
MHPGAHVGYLAVLRMPGALRNFIPALIGRGAFSMITLVILFSVQYATGSFAVAGIASGTGGLASVFTTPLRARLVDRYGQKRVLSLLGLLFGAFLCVMALLTRIPDCPHWAFLGCAIAVGIFVPPLGAAMRMRWSTIASSPAMKERAYSLDAVAEELLFTVGPLLAVTAIHLTSTTLALVIIAGLCVVGTLGLAMGEHGHQFNTPIITAVARGQQPLRQPGFLPLLVALLGTGVVLGVIEISAAAHADQQHATALAGLLLALFGVGSVTGGLAYGRAYWRWPLTHRLLVLVCGMAVVCGLLAAYEQVVFFAVGITLAGLFLAPSLITGYLLADTLTEPCVRTEASSWVSTAVNLGASLATGLAGLIIDACSISVAIGIACAVACVCALLAVPLARLTPAFNDA